MRLERVEVALAQCRSHLKDLPLASVAIRSLLVQALLVLIYSEFQRVIREHIEARCADIEDPELAHFFKSCAGDVTRSLAIAELTGLLNRFDSDRGRDFRRRLQRAPRTRDMYASLLRTRNGVAHGEDLTATLADVGEFYSHAIVVLDHFCDALLRQNRSIEKTTNATG